MPGTISQSSAAETRQRFRRLASQWKEESRFLSNTAQMAMLRPYQAIIGMGESALPFILEELEREPDQWFWALQMITDSDPVRPEDKGNFRKMSKAWIEWGEQQGYAW